MKLMITLTDDIQDALVSAGDKFCTVSYWKNGSVVKATMLFRDTLPPNDQFSQVQFRFYVEGEDGWDVPITLTVDQIDQVTF
jgi:hypothetical protein